MAFATERSCDWPPACSSAALPYRALRPAVRRGTLTATPGSAWTGLGRALLTYQEVGGPRRDKQAGIFYYTTLQPPGDWFVPGFDASAWKEGPSAFGGGYDHVHTPWTDTPGDIWLRREFTLTARPKMPLIRMIHDEDVEVYLNGVLACRDSGCISSYDDFEVDPKAAAMLKPGKNVIAVHCRQTTGGQVIDVGLVIPGKVRGSRP